MNELDELRHFDSPVLSDALDALGIEGALLGLKPQTVEKKSWGFAYTVKYIAYDKRPSDFQPAGNYIDEVPAGVVLVIDNEGREDCTVLGGILTQMASIKNIKATVINGACRDLSEIKKHAYPLYCKSVTMRSGKNRVLKTQTQCELKIGLVTIRPGDIVFSDACGVIIIPKNKFSEVLQKASKINETEQKILSSIRNGMSLEKARDMYRYDKPWLTFK